MNKKVKNVISGYLSQMEITELHILNMDEEHVIFSGDIENYINVEEDMDDYKNLVSNFMVKSAMEYHGKLYLIV